MSVAAFSQVAMAFSWPCVASGEDKQVVIAAILGILSDPLEKLSAAFSQ